MAPPPRTSFLLGARTGVHVSGADTHTGKSHEADPEEGLLQLERPDPRSLGWDWPGVSAVFTARLVRYGTPDGPGRSHPVTPVGDNFGFHRSQFFVWGVFAFHEAVTWTLTIRTSDDEAAGPNPEACTLGPSCHVAARPQLRLDAGKGLGDEDEDCPQGLGWVNSVWPGTVGDVLQCLAVAGTRAYRFLISWGVLCQWFIVSC